MRRKKSGVSLADSSPCIDCYNKMRDANVKTIVYSSINGEVVKQRMRNYRPKVMSLGRQFIINGYAPIFRDRLDGRIIKYTDDKSTSVSSDSDDNLSVSSYESSSTTISDASNNTENSTTKDKTTKDKTTKKLQKKQRFINKLTKKTKKYK